MQPHPYNSAEAGKGRTWKLVLGLLASCVFTLLPTEASARAQAGSFIYNQAVATFTWNRIPFQVTSNQVATEVLGIYDFNITPDGSVDDPAHGQRVAPGSTAYLPYTLTNTGNIADSYLLSLPSISADFNPDNLAFYHDRNGNGMHDPGEPVMGNTTPELRPGESIHLLVRIDIPVTARPGDRMVRDLVGRSRGDQALAPQEEHVLELTVTNRAVMRLTKRPSVNTTFPGNKVTYTMDAVNVGGAPAYPRLVTVDYIDREGILVQSAIPESDSGGTKYVSDSISGAPFGHTPIFSTDDGDTWSEDEPADPADITNVGYLIESTIVPGQSLRLQFDVEVSMRRGEGPLYSEGDLKYAEIEDGPEIIAEADTLIQVRVPDGQLAVFIGPEGEPRAAVNGDTNADFTIAPGLGPADPDSELPDHAEVAGNWVVFRNTVENASGKADTVNIEIDAGRSNLPVGWTVMLMQGDGLTPLNDSNGDGRRDVGRLQPGQQVAITARVYIPADTEPGDNDGAGFRSVLRASMASSPQVFNLTTNIIESVVAADQVWGPVRKRQRVDAQPMPGDTITYILEFGNQSSQALTNVVIIDEIADELVNVRRLTEGTITDRAGSSQTIEVESKYEETDDGETRIAAWNLSEVPAGFRGRVSFQADFARGLRPGTEVENDFFIRSDETQSITRSNTVAAVVGIPDALTIEKTATVSEVEIGDLLLYTVTVANSGVTPLQNVAVHDTLPRGFRYDRGSAVIDGRPAEPEIGEDGHNLTWRLRRLRAGESLEISYACFVTADAIRGDGRNTAVLSGLFPSGFPASVSAFYEVEVTEGMFANRSVIFGKVFLDQNDNRVQDAGEPGIGGVRLYLEDGTYVETDREGKFHFEGIRPGMRVVRLDESTLDPELAAQIIDSSHAGNPLSRFVDLKYGTPHKANFRVVSRAQQEAEPPPEMIAERPGRMRPFEMIAASGATALDLAADSPVQVIYYHDQDNGAVHVQFLGTALGEKVAPGWFDYRDNPYVRQIRVHDDPVGRQAKVQVRLEEETAGFPPVRIRETAAGLTIFIGPAAEQLLQEATGEVGTADDEDARTDRDADDDGGSPGAGEVKPQFISPEDGTAFISRSRINIRVSCHLAAEFDLFVNDEPVDKSRIGETQYRVQERRVVYGYVGVSLEPGANRLRFSARAPGQEEAESVEITIHRSAAPAAIQVQTRPETLTADGRTEPVLEMFLLDEKGVPTASGSVITVLIDKGEIVSSDLRPVETGHQVQVRDGVARVRLSAADRPQTRQVKVLAGDLEYDATLRFSPELRDWIITGVAGASVQRQEQRDEYEGEGKSRSTEVDERLAFFAKGRLPFDTLLTASYDSAKEFDDGRIFQQRDPLEYYAVYGDESEQKYEAESRDKVFVRLERYDSHVMWGDFETGLDENRLAAYDRSFTGAHTVLQSNWLSLQGFFSRNDQARARSEIRGQGISGYYEFADRNLINNSEQVRIETRDRFHPERVLENRSMRRYADYDIDYERGRILFRQPVPSVDQNLDPVFIVVEYEVDGRKASDYNVYGGRAAVHDPERRVELGVTSIIEEASPGDYTLQGVDAAVELFPEVRLRGEYAETQTIEGVKDQGHVLELTSDLEKARFRLWYEDVGEDFENISMRGVTAGLTTYGLEGKFQVAESLRFRDQLYSRRNSTANTSSRVVLHDNIYSLNGLDLLLGGGYVSETEERREEADERRRSSILRGGAGLELGQRWRLDALHQHAFGDTTFEQPTRTEGKVSYKIDDLTRGYLSGERRDSMAGGTEHNLALGVERQFNRYLSGFQEMRLDGVADSRRIASGSGLDLRVPVTEELTFDATGEISRALREERSSEDGAVLSKEDFWSVTLAANYRPFASPYTASTRYEVRDSDASTAHLFEVGGTVRLNPNHTLFGRNIFTYRHEREVDTSDSWTVDLRTGWAYRPVDNDRLMILSDIDVKTESGTRAASRNRLDRYMYSGELHYQPLAHTWIETKYAAKLVRADFANTDLFSDVKALRVQYDLTDSFYAAGGLRMLSVYEGPSHELSYGLELGYNLRRNLRMAGGYNFRGFEDRDFSRNDNWQKGFYVGLYWKFDESILGVLNRLEGR